MCRLNLGTQSKFQPAAMSVNAALEIFTIKSSFFSTKYYYDAKKCVIIFYSVLLQMTHGYCAHAIFTTESMSVIQALGSTSIYLSDCLLLYNWNKLTFSILER